MKFRYVNGEVFGFFNKFFCLEGGDVWNPSFFGVGYIHLDILLKRIDIIDSVC